jgi:glycosyltransferase involved in cell wall biosynthesis
MALPAAPTRLSYPTLAPPPARRAAPSQPARRPGRAERLTVSIIMPTYRRAHTIHRTVGQIVAQTYPYWELIVVNNSRSGDYVFADPRIRVYRHAAHASASYARNQGLAYATGELVVFFDDDDDMFPTYLERLVGAFKEHPEAKLVHCGMVRGDGQTNFAPATPVCCLRRELATPTWQEVHRHDIRYYGDIIETNGLSEETGDIVLVPELLVRARSDPKGGLRSGRL